MTHQEEFTERLLADSRVPDVRHRAYILATVKHETANTFRPIDEYGKGRNRKYGEPINGQIYYGRGYVQLTWHENYAKFGKILNRNLVEQPDLANEPDIAYDILIIGMTRGLFTGKKLIDYINQSECDYVGARRIINGQDRAELIAGYARVIERVLMGNTPEAA